MRVVAEERVYRMEALVEELVYQRKAMVEREGPLPKKLEHLGPVLVPWAVEVAVGWRLHGVDRAAEVVEVDWPMVVVHPDLWEEAEGVRRR